VIPAGDVEDVAGSVAQLALELEPGPPADTPPPCRCCRGGGWMPRVGGWSVCTWCDGTCIADDVVHQLEPARLAGVTQPSAAGRTASPDIPSRRALELLAS
jgi:hypothetical protein